MAGIAIRRKLGPIYDSIETKNYKLAFKLAKQAQQKFPNSHVIKALYGVTLERLGKIDEALEVGRQVCKEMQESIGTRTGEDAATVMDESVVNTLTIVFKAANKLEELQGTLETMAGAAPARDGVSAYASLFSACARTFSFLKMQQVAMKLYKRTGDHNYVFWAVTSMYLQYTATCAPHLLMLAETMCKKTQKEKGLDSLASYGPDALLIYLEVLYSQKKYDRALELLRQMKGKGTRLLQSQLRMLEAMLCICCGEMDAALDTLEKHIEENHEDWHASKVFMDILLPAGGASGGKHSWIMTTMDGVISINPLDKATPFVEKLQQESPSRCGEGGRERIHNLMQRLETKLTDKGKTRAFYLMQLDFLCRQMEGLREGQSAASRKKLEEDLSIAIIKFWEVSGSSISFSNDLVAFLPYLSKASAGGVSKELGENMAELKATLLRESCEPTIPVKKTFSKVLSAYEVDFLLQNLVDRKESVSENLTEMISVFDACTPLYHGYDERENTILDPLVMLISRQVWSRGKAHFDKVDGRMNCIMQMLVAFKSGVDISPYNSSMLLSLTLLYGYLGVSDLCSDCFWKLDIKYIQLETIGGHMLLPYLTSSGNEREASKFCDRHVGFHEDHDRHAGDTFAMTFDHGTYLESIDFDGFRKRLCDSVVRYSIAVEGSILRILQKGVQGLMQVEAIMERECRELQALLEGASSGMKLESEDLHFNMDLSVRPEWSPPLGRGGCSPHGVLSWWDNLGQDKESGPTTSVQCWWDKVNAVNSLTNESALAYRKDYRTSVLARFSLVQAFGCVLSQDRKDLEAHVGVMAKHLGIACASDSGGPDLDDLLIESLSPGDTGRKLQVLTLSVFAVTASLCAFGGESADGVKFDKGLKVLRRNFDHVRDVVFTEEGILPVPGEVFFGGIGVVAVSTYVREVVSWSSLLFCKWMDMMQEMKKKQRKEKRKGIVKEGGQASQVADAKAVSDFLDSFKTTHLALKERIEGVSCQIKAEDLASTWWHKWKESGDVSFDALHHKPKDRAGGQEAVMKDVAEGQLGTLKVALDKMAKYMALLK